MGIFILYTWDICKTASEAVVETSRYFLMAVLENSLIIAVLLSEDDLLHFATFELLHASHGGLRARKQVASADSIATQTRAQELMAGSMIAG